MMEIEDPSHSKKSGTFYLCWLAFADVATWRHVGDTFWRSQKNDAGVMGTNRRGIYSEFGIKLKGTMICRSITTDEIN